MKNRCKYIQALLIWVSIIPIAIFNGGLREYVLRPLIGNAALTASGIILAVCIFLVALATVPRIRGCTRKDYLIFGIMWATLTNLFDAIGGGLDALIQAYDITSGNTWLFVVLSCLFSPALAALPRPLPQKEHGEGES